VGIRGPFPRVKHGEGMLLATYLYLVPRTRMSRCYTSSPLAKRLYGM
jgi:hypothetical protein